MKRSFALAVTAAASLHPFLQAPPAAYKRKLLIAHRGASAYAPEHTAAAYALAVAQGADFVEQDLAITKDGVLICLHDASLERTTDVRVKFPDRASYLAADFTLAEIRTLDAGSWFAPRFAGQRVPTFDEAITLVKGRAGLFPELKGPALYRARNIDMPKLVADALARHGLDGADAGRTPVMLQSFDEPAIRALKARLPLVPRVLLFDATAAPVYATGPGLEQLARWATGIGPSKQVIETDPAIVSRAHALGMSVMPWTFRAVQTGRFPDVTAEMRYFLDTLGVDGVFTDNPDRFPARPRVSGARSRRRGPF